MFSYYKPLHQSLYKDEFINYYANQQFIKNYSNIFHNKPQLCCALCCLQSRNTIKPKIKNKCSFPISLSMQNYHFYHERGAICVTNCHMKQFLFHEPILLFLLIQNSRQTLNFKQLFQSHSFLKISAQATQLRYQFKSLYPYSDDKIKFMTKIEVNESKSQQQRNEIQIIKQPIHSNQDIITFLLILKWFPNAMKTYKHPRKASFISSQKDIFKNKIKSKMESSELLHLVFLISQKIYLPQKYADQFVNIISQKQQIHHRQINCITIILNNTGNKDYFLSTHFTSQSQFHQYIYETNSDRSSIGSNQINKIALMKRKRPSEKSPRFGGGDRSLRQSQIRSSRMSQAKSINMDEKSQKRQVSCNLSKIKRYFSAIEYLITQVELKPQMIAYHLNDDKNIINLAFKLETIEQFFKEWPKYNSFSSLYQLNKSKIIQAEVSQCLSNYKLMLSMQLSQINSMNIDNIYVIIRQLHSKTVNSFVEATKQFMHDPNYNEFVTQIQSQIHNLESQLINNYALSKYEYGNRSIKDLQKKKAKRSSMQNYILMRIIGREEINNLDIGYKMYKQIIEGKLKESFQELLHNKSHLRNRYNHFTGNNDQDMLNNIQNRIDICQQKKKMLENAIQLSLKERESLKHMMHNMQKNHTDMNSIVSQLQQ